MYHPGPPRALGGPWGAKIRVFFSFWGQGGLGGWVWASPMAPRGEGPILCLPMNPFKGPILSLHSHPVAFWIHSAMSDTLT